MNDERYTFIEDVRDKKRIARGSHNKRTHCGKRGGVKFPSDYLTKKEIKAMSGEVKSYRLNDTMTWKEFKEMPDDIKIVYINGIRERFGAPDKKIAEMLGVCKVTVCGEFKRLGIGVGSASGKKKWDEEGFDAWVYGVPEPVSEPAHEITQESCENAAESICEAKRAVPRAGAMILDGNIEDSVNTILALLGGANVCLKVSWDVLGDAE